MAAMVLQNGAGRGKTGVPTENQVKLLLSASKSIEIDNLHRAIDRLLSGYALVLVPEAKRIFAFSLPGFDDLHYLTETQKNFKVRYCPVRHLILFDVRV